MITQIFKYQEETMKVKFCGFFLEILLWLLSFGFPFIYSLEKAAGIVIYRNNTRHHTVQYLMLQSAHGSMQWSPPKGKIYISSLHLQETTTMCTLSPKLSHLGPSVGRVELNESNKEAAFRELQEECGFCETDIKLVPDFLTQSKYKVKKKPKNVVFWLAELVNPNQEVKLSEEHADYKWATYFETLCLAQYSDQLQLMRVCNDYLKKTLPAFNKLILPHS